MPERSQSRPRAVSIALAAVALLAATAAVPAPADSDRAPPEVPAGDGGGHFAAPDPATLTAGQAAAIYREIRDRMAGGYRLSGLPAARNFARWQRFNAAPYRSATHGERFVNNYANAVARAYGRHEAAGIMPPGATVVKDTFYVSQSGAVFPGALMIMEKMPAGFDAATGDWRYAMVMPDGSLFGETGGENAHGMVFCADCHALAAATDYLFFVPEPFRIGAGSPAGDP